jgi:hypothetical protein
MGTPVPQVAPQRRNGVEIKPPESEENRRMIDRTYSLRRFLFGHEIIRVLLGVVVARFKAASRQKNGEWPLILLDLSSIIR